MFVFDARTVTPSVGFEPWPDGWYKFRVLRTNCKTTSAGDGGYLQCDVECLEGPNQGKINFLRFNIINKNEQTMDIARKQLSALCHVTGVFNIQANPQGPDDNHCPMLHNIPFQGRATLSDNKTGNNFQAFKDINGNEPGKAGSGAQQPQIFQPQQQQPPMQPQGSWPQQGQPQGQGQPQQQWTPPQQPNPNQPSPQGPGQAWPGTPNQPQQQQPQNPQQGGTAPSWSQSPSGQPQNAPWSR